jgi:methylated-DNA-[protein]-cysteine S-methyltransferase
MNAFYSTFETPLGPFSVAVNEIGAVIATAFGNIDGLRRQRPDIISYEHAEAPIVKTRDQILAYLSGARRDFQLPTAPGGSPFQQRVWQALCKIPRGETRSYGELARGLGSSARAVGRANATNPLCVIVPCHRVIGADGSLTGFAFGVEIKRQLLALESV